MRAARSGDALLEPHALLRSGRIVQPGRKRRGVEIGGPAHQQPRFAHRVLQAGGGERAAAAASACLRPRAHPSIAASFAA
jgi:hypothetical protein